MTVVTDVTLLTFENIYHSQKSPVIIIVEGRNVFCVQIVFLRPYNFDGNLKNGSSAYNS
jgi:hypothetical protein